MTNLIKLNLTELTASKIVEIANDKLNKKISLNQCEFFTETFEYDEKNEKFTLEKIFTNVEIDVSENDEYDVEMLQFELTVTENNVFNDYDDIEMFIDETLQKLTEQ